eukprot:4028141-Alexandrium_andersonii.AAC.1
MQNLKAQLAVSRHDIAKVGLGDVKKTGADLLKRNARLRELLRDYAGQKAAGNLTTTTVVDKMARVLLDGKGA